jgi:hypothetical protein
LDKPQTQSDASIEKKDRNIQDSVMDYDEEERRLQNIQIFGADQDYDPHYLRYDFLLLQLLLMLFLIW